MSTLHTDDSTQFALPTPTDVLGRMFVRFPDCDQTDMVLLVPVLLQTRSGVTLDAFQWVFAGNPSIPASDLFQNMSLAWEFAWLAWEEQPIPDAFLNRPDRRSDISR